MADIGDSLLCLLSYLSQQHLCPLMIQREQVASSIDLKGKTGEGWTQAIM
jgi:hypothetical protein